MTEEEYTRLIWDGWNGWEAMQILDGELDPVRYAPLREEGE